MNRLPIHRSSRKLFRPALLMAAFAGWGLNVATAAAQRAPAPPVAAAAPAAEATPATEETPVVVVYPIGDLLERTGAQPATMVPGMASPGGFAGAPMGMDMGAPDGFGATQAPAGPERTEFITSLLREMVDPQSWRDNGGTVGGIRAFNEDLLILQTPANHRAIEVLLGQLRRGPGQVHVEMTWVEMDPRTLAEVSTLDGTVRVLNAPALSLPAEAILDRVEFTTFSGEPIALVSGSKMPYVSDIEPVIGPGAVGFDPTIQFLHTGMTVSGDVRLISPTDARLNLRASMTTLHEMKTFSIFGGSGTGSAEQPVLPGFHATDAAQPASPAAAPHGFIQQPALSERTFDSRFVIPVGKSIVVGGLSSNSTTKPAAGNGKLCYLIVTVQGK